MVIFRPRHRVRRIKSASSSGPFRGELTDCKNAGALPMASRSSRGMYNGVCNNFGGDSLCIHNVNFGYDPIIEPAQAAKITEFVREYGVFSALPSLLSSPWTTVVRKESEEFPPMDEFAFEPQATSTPRIEGVNRLECPKCARIPDLDGHLCHRSDRNAFSGAGDGFGIDMMNLRLNLNGKGGLNLSAFAEPSPSSSPLGGFISTSKPPPASVVVERQQRRSRWGGGTNLPGSEDVKATEDRAPEDCSDPFRFDRREEGDRSGGKQENGGASHEDAVYTELGAGLGGVLAHQPIASASTLGSRSARKSSRFGGGEPASTPPITDERARRRLFARQLGVEWNDDFLGGIHQARKN